ncbi:MAG: flagellar basal body-associated FliL family protein [Pseudomonadota bacterium]
MKKIIAGVVVLALLTVGGLHFAGIIHLYGEEATEEHVAVEAVAPTYLNLDPPFVVNFTHRGTLRYLQVSLELSYEDPALLAKVTERMPEIRNDLILLFSNQDYEKLSTMAGKEQLRGEIFAAINHVIGVEDPMTAAHVAEPLSLGSGPAPEVIAEAEGAEVHTEEAPTKIGEVFITNFVMQ